MPLISVLAADYDSSVDCSPRSSTKLVKSIVQERSVGTRRKKTADNMDSAEQYNSNNYTTSSCLLIPENVVRSASPITTGASAGPAPPTLLLPTTTSFSHGVQGPPLICEQGPSAPSSPTSPGGGRLRRPSPLTPEAMRRINLLTAGYPSSIVDFNKLSPLSPNYPTSDLGSSPRSSISIGHGWTGFRDHRTSDFTDADSDICSKDLLSPGMLLSPAPFSPFSDCTDPPETPYSSYGGRMAHSPMIPTNGLHFSFDPIRCSSSMSNRSSASSHYLIVPDSRFDKETRERSRSDSEMATGAHHKDHMMLIGDPMDTSILHSTVSVPASTKYRPTSSSIGQYKKRLLHKYEQEQGGKMTKRSSYSQRHNNNHSPPISIDSFEQDDFDFRSISRRPSRQATIEEPVPPLSPLPTTDQCTDVSTAAAPQPSQQLSVAVHNALASQRQFDCWLQQQLVAWQQAWYRNPTLLPSAGVTLSTPHGLIGVHAPSPQLLAPPPLTDHLPRGHMRHTTRTPDQHQLVMMMSNAPGPIKAANWRRSRSESDVSTGNYVCQHCGQAFGLHDRLAKHIASRHRDRSASAAGGDDSASKTHKCTICTKSFGRSDMLTRHMRLHTGLKPYGCHICGQVFSRSDHLATHQRTHSGEKPYSCPQCSYAASRRDMITRHMRTHSHRSADQPSSSNNIIDFSSAAIASLTLGNNTHPPPVFTKLFSDTNPAVVDDQETKIMLLRPEPPSGD